MTGSTKQELIDHLLAHAVRTGEFTLKSGRTSTWFCDGKQTVCRAEGLLLVADLALETIPDDVTAIGGLTAGADPVAFGVAAVAATRAQVPNPLVTLPTSWSSAAANTGRPGPSNAASTLRATPMACRRSASDIRSHNANSPSSRCCAAQASSSVDGAPPTREPARRRARCRGRWSSPGRNASLTGQVAAGRSAGR